VQCDLEWRGLWHPVQSGRLRNELIGRAIIYLVTPIAIALLFGEIHSVDQFTRAYVGSFIVGSSVGGCFEVAYRVMWTRLITRRPSWPMRIAGHVITIPIAAGLGTLLANAVGNALLGWHENDFVRLYLQDIVISAVIITILVTADEANGRAREASRREALARMAAVHAELATLQARTDPHFLFNSLNTVAALIPEDPELAETLLLRLAAVFRYALDAGRKGSVALAEEIAAVTAYLEVEALRLGPRLSTPSRCRRSCSSHWSRTRSATAPERGAARPRSWSVRAGATVTSCSPSRTRASQATPPRRRRAAAARSPTCARGSRSRSPSGRSSPRARRHPPAGAPRS
jgi:hypothetical protein